MALAARDQALAKLPDYSHWAADRPADEIQSELIDRLEKLWTTTHHLTARLGNLTREDDWNLLQQDAQALAAGMNGLWSRFAELADQQETVRSPGDWEACTAAAAVPFSETAERSTRNVIWQRLQDIAKHDVELAAASQTGTLTLSAEQRAEQPKQVRMRARAQALMALAAIDDRWFNDSADFPAKEGDDRASVVSRVDALSDADPGRSQPWRREIAATGDLVGARWQKMTPEIEQLVDEQGGITNFQAFQDRLVKAERLERQLDDRAPWIDDEMIEAATRLRQARLHTTLLTLADRAWEDHWYDEDSKDRYYAAIGSRFINDAAKYFPQSAPVLAAREKMNRKGQVALEAQPLLVLTSEAEARISCKVVVREGIVPEGLPVVQAIVEQPLESAQTKPVFIWLEFVTIRTPGNSLSKTR